VKKKNQTPIKIGFELSQAPPSVPPPRDRQLLFPLRGAYRWHTRASTTLVDPNQVAFIPNDEACTETAPARAALSSLIINVSAALNRDLWPSAGPDPFAARVARMSSRLQARYSWFADVAASGSLAPEDGEEQAIGLVLSSTREATGRGSDPRPRAARTLAERVKLLLVGRGRSWSLGELAAYLGISPPYLTDAFRRVEGVPIMRYQRQLQLMRALRKLPGTDDLGSLALELGFSSHSHFANAFRSVMGIAPSRYREMVRRSSAHHRRHPGRRGARR
jgi:AraC-like DNA-binding protein